MNFSATRLDWLQIIIGFVFIGIMFFYIRFLLDLVHTVRHRKAPFVPSKVLDIDFLAKSGAFEGRESVTDLGCGNGSVLHQLVSQGHIKKGIGYDLNRMIVRRGRWKAKRAWLDITLHAHDFTQATITTDIVYIYLLPYQLECLENRFLQAVPHNTIVIANSFRFPNRQPYQTITNPETKTIFRFYRHPQSTLQDRSE